MKCNKKVYDVVGNFSTSGNKEKYHIINGAILLPYAQENGKNTKLAVEICQEVDVSSNGYNARLITIRIAGNKSSLRNEEVQDFFPFNLRIEKGNLDFKRGKSVRLIVVHDNEFCEEPDPELAECARDYVSQAGYLRGWEFEPRKCEGPVWWSHGPKKSGESVLAGM